MSRSAWQAPRWIPRAPADRSRIPRSPNGSCVPLRSGRSRGDRPWRRTCRGCTQAAQLDNRLFAEAVADHVDGESDRIGKAYIVGTAVAPHTDAVEAEEHGAIVDAPIHALAQLLPGTAGKQVAELGEGRCLERFAHEIRVQTGGAFDRLQRDVAGESIVDHDMHGAV